MMCGVHNVMESKYVSIEELDVELILQVNGVMHTLTKFNIALTVG